MRILIIGSTGHVGSAAAQALQGRHEAVGLSRSTQPSIDLLDADSIERAFDQVG